MFRLKNTLALAVTALVAAQANAAVPTLVGGGATLPAVAYIGSNWLNGNARLSTTAANTAKPKYTNPYGAGTTSLFYVWTNGTAGNPTVSYCQTGSGGGRKVLEGVNSATGVCSDYTTSPTGFSAPFDAQFAASDAPLLGTDYNTFYADRDQASYAAGTSGTFPVTKNSAGDITAETVTNYAVALNAKTQPVQFPSLAGSIGIVYNPPAAVGTKKQITLTESQICQIFSGAVTTWGALVGDATDTTPITIVYRRDNSGTTFNFTNHLAAVCPTAVPVAVGSVFKTASVFTSAVASTVLHSSSSIGSDVASGQSGNGNVVGYVATNPGTIGYAEIADAVARSKTVLGGVLTYAEVKQQPDIAASYYCSLDTAGAADAVAKKPKCNAKDTSGDKLSGAVVTLAAKKFAALDPVKNFPSSVAVTVTQGDVLATDGVTAVSTSNALSGITSATPQPVHPECLNIVNPTSIAIPALTAGGDYVQYPIMAVTYLMGFNAGNAVLTAASSVATSTTVNADAPPTTVTTVNVSAATDVHSYVASLLAAPQNISSKVKTIGAKTGFAGLTISGMKDGSGNAITPTALIASCVNQ